MICSGYNMHQNIASRVMVGSVFSTGFPTVSAFPEKFLILYRKVGGVDLRSRNEEHATHSIENTTDVHRERRPSGTANQLPDTDIQKLATR